jgi:DNA polymerase-2
MNSRSSAAGTWHEGLLLTQEWSDLPSGCVLTFWGRGAEGPFELRLATRPVLFVPRTAALPCDVQPAERRPVALRDFLGGDVDALYFCHQHALRAARARLIAAAVPVFEGDLDPAARYLMERFIHGVCSFSGEGQDQDGVTVYHNPRLRPGGQAPPLSILSFDIETGSAGQLYAIGYRFSGGGREARQVYLAGRGHRRRDPPLTPCEDEAELLRRFLGDVRTLDPDVLAGWNILGFDLPVLAGACAAAGLTLALGRRGLEARLITGGGARARADVPGRLVVDGLVALRGMVGRVEDYRLETVAQRLLGEGKRMSDDVDKQAEIDRLYREDPVELAAYNLRDAELVTALFDRTRTIDLVVSRSRISGLLPDRLGRSVAAFDHVYLPRLHRKGYVAPDRDDRDVADAAALPGGLVLPPQPGVHEHVVLLDFKSLYPSVIRTFHVCPYAKLMAAGAPLANPAGTAFSARDAILPDYLADLTAQRARARAEGDVPLAQAIKLLMNSFYGVMGSPGSRFYDPAIAATITGTGQWVLRAARDRLAGRGYAVLYGDTDSLFVQLPAADAAAPHESGRCLAGEVTAFLSAEIQARFGAASVIEMAFERYYRRFYLPAARHQAHGDGHGASDADAGEGEPGEPAAEGAAKRYAGLHVHEDGREELQVTGLESVRSDSTALARRVQTGALERFFRGADLGPWLRGVVADLRRGACDAELVYRRRLRKSPREYTHAIPPHVRAARLLPEDQQRRLGAVAYVMTLRGPVPVQLPHADADYEHYVQRQIQPVVEDLLALSGQRFDEVLSGEQQLTLF